ncbi:MAG: hypothetical protein LBP36_00075 [Oscillospiraceae bacterium]|nr:hypothetical protein [Oscillospiraceae bacterium]
MARKKRKRELSLDDLGQVVGGKHIHDSGLIFKSAEEETMKNFESEEVKKSLDKLSDKQRRRIVLRFYHKFTNQQIAEVEKCSTRMVEKSILIAIQNLKKILQNIYEPKF